MENKIFVEIFINHTKEFLYRCKRFIFFFLITISSILAQESWPSETGWVPLLNANWQRFTDPRDFPQGYYDIVTDVNGSAGYFYSTETSVFFRMVLRTTPLQSPNNLKPFAWFMAIDVDNDNSPDWLIIVGGITETLRIYYNQGVDDDPEILNYQVSDPLITGDVRLVSGGYTIYPNLTYLDFQIPYSALSDIGYGRNVSAFTPIKFFYSTSTTENLTIKDALGPSTTIAGAFADAIILTLESGGVGAFGFIYDTRDLDPYTNQGIWLREETVTVSGLGWPPSGSPYYNSGIRNVRILDSQSNIVWIGTVITDANGDITDQPTWTISNSTLSGLFSLSIEDPTAPAVWYSYDSFTIKAPNILIAKVASTDSTSSGATISYTISIWNTADTTGLMTTIIDYLPVGFTYLTGTTSGLTTIDPTINGQQLTWSGNWTIDKLGQPTDSVTLNFNARVSTSRGIYTNDASAGGLNFNLKSVSGAAPVRVLVPFLSLSKTVNAATSGPGDTLTYTIAYTNSGDGPASYIFILENIPPNTTYLENSVNGNGITVTYSHDNGVSYNSMQTPPVTNLSFQRTSILPAGQVDTITFNVIIN